MAELSQPVRLRLTAVLLAGVAVGLAIAVYAKVHHPALRPIFLVGFSGMLQMKAWLATAALLLVVVQLVTALWLWGRLPGVRGTPRLLVPVHRWSGARRLRRLRPGGGALRVVARLRHEHPAGARAQRARLRLLRRLRGEDARACACAARRRG